MDLKKYHMFGLSMLQLMLVLGLAGLIATGIYEYFF